MNGVILFSHGSLLCGAGDALNAHAAKMRNAPDIGPVEVGYLNYSSPTFNDAVCRLSALGVDRIIVTPFFLVPGYFVSSSLPKAIAAVRPSFPNIEFVVAEPLGTDSLLAAALLDSASAACTEESFWRRGVDGAGESCRLRKSCPLYGTFRCPATPAARSSEPCPSATTPVTDTFPPVDASQTALLVMVHGSPQADANNTMYSVVGMARAISPYLTIEAGFMECNEPTIPMGVAHCVAAGAKRVVAIPYFLHMGTHVADDLPNLTAQARDRYPDVEFAMTGYLGESPLIADLLIKRARSAAHGPATEVVLGHAIG